MALSGKAYPAYHSASKYNFSGTECLSKSQIEAGKRL